MKYLPTLSGAIKIAVVVVILNAIFAMFPQTRIWERLRGV